MERGLREGGRGLNEKREGKDHKEIVKTMGEGCNGNSWNNSN